MHVNLIGMNHHTAPVTIREKIALSSDKLNEGLIALKTYAPQGIILSTCNRTEIYSIDLKENGTEENNLKFFNERIKVQDEILRRYVYAIKDEAAIKHLFRVASGLESLVVGEYEVLGQVRHALETAEKAGMVNFPLRYIFNCAIRASRRVREETEISKNPISVGSVAVDLATKAVADLTKCKMVVIGAGEAGRLVAKVAKERGVSQIVVTSRTKARAEEVAAALHGRAVDLNNLEDELSTTDIVVTCAAAPHRVVGVDQIKKIMHNRSNIPLVLIDIAVPRNVVPEVGSIENIILYSIDDLTEISNINRQRRKGAMKKADGIINEELEKFSARWRNFEVRPIIGALMERAEVIRTAQLNKTLKNLPVLSDEQRENLEAMTKSIVNRILHNPIQYLQNQENYDQSRVVRELFQLDVEKSL